MIIKDTIQDAIKDAHTEHDILEREQETSSHTTAIEFEIYLTQLFRAGFPFNRSLLSHSFISICLSVDLLLTYFRTVRTMRKKEKETRLRSTMICCIFCPRI